MWPQAGSDGSLWVWNAVFCICNCFHVLDVHTDLTPQNIEPCGKELSAAKEGGFRASVAPVTAKLKSKSAFFPALTYNPFWTLPPEDDFCFITGRSKKASKMRKWKGEMPVKLVHYYGWTRRCCIGKPPQIIEFGWVWGSVEAQTDSVKHNNSN